MNLPGIILASESPRRVELLRSIVPEFGIVASHVTEVHDGRLGPRRLCELNAQRKAMAVAERYPEHLVLGADTLVFLEGSPLGKPEDMNEAFRMLSRLSGRAHEVITGVCLVQLRQSRTHLFSEVTHVKFRELTAETITQYLDKVPVLDKAGSYAIQDHGSLIVDHVEGSMSNVVGLPLEALRAALLGFGRETGS